MAVSSAGWSLSGRGVSKEKAKGGRTRPFRTPLLRSRDVGRRPGLLLPRKLRSQWHSQESLVTPHSSTIGESFCILRFWFYVFCIQQHRLLSVFTLACQVFLLAWNLKPGCCTQTIVLAPGLLQQCFTVFKQIQQLCRSAHEASMQLL